MCILAACENWWWAIAIAADVGLDVEVADWAELADMPWLPCCCPAEYCPLCICDVIPMAACWPYWEVGWPYWFKCCAAGPAEGGGVSDEALVAPVGGM